MLKTFLFSLTISMALEGCSSQQDVTKKAEFTDSITKVEMNLNAFGVESDNFPSIAAYIDFAKDSSYCERTYYNPAFKPSTYRLSSTEINRVSQMLKSAYLEEMKTEYKVLKTDQPTSTTTIYIGQKTFVMKDCGLQGDYPLNELYKIVYRL